MQFEIFEVTNKSQKDRFLLTRSLAFERSKYITDVAYQLFFYFQASSDSYKVETTINFTLSTLKDVIIECGASLIHEIAINNKALSLVSIDEIWEENALTFPQGYLIEGRNTIKLKTTSIFSRDSSGFHSYIHHTGDNQICYTVCPPNYAHLIYPCFDQPDIKATFELKVSAPSQWLVISNNPVLETRMESMNFVIIGSSSSRKSWIFKKTPRISTYLFAIAAGNFVEIKPSKPTTVPMRLYCSSHKHGYLVTQSEEFFSLIESGIKYYSQFFGTDFPFEKYDQVFCPEFKYLGMENPGMVCITESYIYMTQMSAFKKSQRALTVLHELSHMWFGDLVTMKWWDSIWLNEGFASFISYHTLSVVSKDPFAHTIDVKFIFYKQEALNTDNLDSTHPVEQDVKDTEAATNIFDDITYCKGSAVIKHLMYMIGEENFSKALSTYFKKFAWNNADSVDFFNVIQSVLEEERSEINAMRRFGTSSADSENTLQKWIHDWLETEGKVNVCFEVTSTPEKMLVEIVKENLPRRVTLNKHIDLEFALFYQDYGNKLSRIVSERICLKEEKTTVEIPLNGFSAKDLGVALNYKDYAYADIIMDNLSIEFFLRNIKQVEPLMKAQIFISMIKKIESGKMNPVPLFEWVAQQLSEDEIPYLTSEYLIYSTKLMDCYLPEKLREKCGRIMFSKLYSILGSYNNIQDRSKEELTVTIQEYITNFAYSNEDMLLLVKWMQKKNSSLNKVNLTGVLMGRIIEEIFLRKLLSQSEIDYMKSVYVKKHPYYLNFTIGAEADIETKMKLWEKFVAFKPSDGSHYEFSCMMKGINNPHDKDIYTLAERFFDDLLRVFENNENEYCNVFFTNLFPKLHNPDFMIERIQGLMDRAHAYANLKNLLEEKLYQAKICGELEKYV